MHARIINTSFTIQNELLSQCAQVRKVPMYIERQTTPGGECIQGTKRNQAALNALASHQLSGDVNKRPRVAL